MQPNSTHIVAQIMQSLGDNPTTEHNAEGIPNCHPSSTDILELSMNILQNVSSAKNVRPSVVLAARIAFLV